MSDEKISYPQDIISDLDRALHEERMRKRTEAVAKQFSPAVRDSPLCQALAGAGAGLSDWEGLLNGWVHDQWVRHHAKAELRDAATVEPPREDGEIDEAEM